MKYIGSCLLVSLLLSCSSRPLPSSRNRIVLESRDGLSREYFLLAVRPDAIVVSPYSPDAERSEMLFPGASVIPVADVDHLVYQYGPTINHMSWLLPGMFGGALGLIGFFEDLYGERARLTYTLSLGIPGFLAGFGLSFFTHTDDQEYFVDTKAHIRQLKERAIFQYDEPPELQRLR